MARPSRRPGKLPVEVTSFVGRRHELAEVRRKLASARLLSLVGPGGVGKSRLALRAVTDLARGYRGGAWWVELAEVRDPALIPNAVLAACDLRDQAGTEPTALLLAHVRDRDMLIVLDNCEHLLEAAARLAAELVRAAPGVRVIATSREPLTAPGEHLLPVPPLELPPVDRTEPLGRLAQNEAVALFVQRAAAASGDFELTEGNRSTVADLCRRLDGLPLAIELAAVRTRVLGVEEILDRLSDRFGLLTGGGHAALPRHQTLETAIDWSYDLLDPDERTMLRRLCVFAGRFTAEDVAAICAYDLDQSAGDLLGSLVEKSLVIKEDVRGVTCYRLHETMREYARRRLAEAGEQDELQRRCVDHYVSTCQAHSPQARFHLPEWLSWIDLEIDNARAVLRRCLDQSDSERGIQLATSLGWFWITRATTEGVRWLDEALASGPGRPETLGWSYFIRGFLAVLQNDWVAARPLLENAIAASRAAMDPVQLSHSLAMASIAATMAGDFPEADRRIGDAQMVAEEADDVPSVVGVLQARSLRALFAGDFETLKAASTEGARLSREVGDLYALHMMNLNLGGAALFDGDMVESKARYSESLRIAYRIDDRIGLYYLLAALGYHAALAGQPKIAAQLLGASETIRVGAGATVMAVQQPLLDETRTRAVAALGETRFESELEAGRRMPREAAVALALGEPIAPPAGAANGAEDGLLARREAEVARLVAEGLSNKQIGARLFISERTVDSHVRSILNKLGFNSRAQIAGWVTSGKR